LAKVELRECPGNISGLRTPPEHAISEEEQALLWRTLESIPEAYREPLVLYYRLGRSMREVAQALELSEDAVKQRLSRGRRMLRREVAAFVEENLARSGPKKAFTVGTLGMLRAPGPAGAGSLGSVLGPVLGFVGGLFGTWASVRNTRSPRERRHMIRMASRVWLYVLGFLAVQTVVGVYFRSVFLSLWWQLSTWSFYLVVLVVIIVRSNGRQRQIQMENGTYVGRPQRGAGNQEPESGKVQE